VRVLVGSDNIITSPMFVGADEEAPSNLDTGVPTVAVTDAAGTTLTAPTASLVGDGRYKVKLTAAAHTTDIDRLTVTWTGTADGMVQTLTQTVEVVDGHYATLAELRQLDELSDTSSYPSDALRWARDSYAELVEEYLGASFVGRLGIDTGPYCGRNGVLLSKMFPRTVRSFLVDGTAADLTGIELSDWGGLRLATWPSYTATYPQQTILYSYGAAPMPECLRVGCRAYVRALLKSGGSGVENAYAWADGNGGTYRTSTANWEQRRPTGWMAVDDQLNSAPNHRAPNVA